MSASVKARRDIDMTHGPLLVKMIRFVLPLMATNLLQMLYNAADMMVVSLSNEPNAMGAISTTGAMINLIINLFMGFSVGANVMVARHLGANDEENASRAVHTSLCMSVIFGAIGAVIGLIISRPLLVLLGDTGSVLDLADTYTKIYFSGVIFLSVTNFAIAILRAKGDTKTPLIVLTCTGLLNAGLNLFFVLVCGMSVEGVALATAIANAVSAVVLVRRLARDTGPCRFSFRKLKMEKRAFLDILHVGVPAGVQGSLFAISNMLIQSAILQVNNTMLATLPDDGSGFQPVVNGNGAGGNLEGFVYTATNCAYQAAITFTSQNVGAEEYDRVKRVRLWAYALAIFISVFFSGILIVFRTPLLSLYGVVPAEAGTRQMIAYETAVTRILWIQIPYFTLALMDTGSGITRGVGKSVTSTVVTLTGACLLRIVWIYTVFRAQPTLEMIYLSYPVSWVVTAIFQYLFADLALRKLIREKKARDAVPQPLA